MLYTLRSVEACPHSKLIRLGPQLDITSDTELGLSERNVSSVCFIYQSERKDDCKYLTGKDVGSSCGEF
jgi:hypothetical protein